MITDISVLPGIPQSCKAGWTDVKEIARRTDFDLDTRIPKTVTVLLRSDKMALVGFIHWFYLT